MDSRLTLAQAYETTFEIFDHLRQEQQESLMADAAQKRPLAMVAMHHAEDFCKGSKLYDMLVYYSRARVWDVFHISLVEFLSFPHELVEFIIRHCMKIQEQEAAKAEKIAADLANAAQGKPPIALQRT